MIDSCQEIAKSLGMSRIWWGLERWSNKATRMKLEDKTNWNKTWNRSKLRSTSRWPSLSKIKWHSRRKNQKRRRQPVSQDLHCKNPRQELLTITSKVNYSNQSKLAGPKSNLSMSILKSKRQCSIKMEDNRCKEKRTFLTTIDSSPTPSTTQSLPCQIQGLLWRARRTRIRLRGTLQSLIAKERIQEWSPFRTTKTFQILSPMEATRAPKERLWYSSSSPWNALKVSTSQDSYTPTTKTQLWTSQLLKDTRKIIALEQESEDISSRTSTQLLTKPMSPRNSKLTNLLKKNHFKFEFHKFHSLNKF